jgi:DNA-directed RNA polymerase sigma subunit (sigma70/sigma32)
MTMTRWQVEDGWPYPDALGDLVDVAGEADDDLVAVRTDTHLFDTLNPLEREVIAARFGLAGHEVRTMTQLHADLGVPGEDLRHAYAEGLEKLRIHLQA